MDAFTGTRLLALLLLICSQLPLASAQSIGTIKTTDFEDAKPKTDLPDSKIIELDLKKLKNANGHIILRQFPNRVRVEFEGSRLPFGTYTVGKSDSCSRAASVLPPRYKSGWSELHRFKSDQAHIATEKSLPKVTIADLQGKALTLFRVGADKYELIACKTID
jgi:hypothetical protein